MTRLFASGLVFSAICLLSISLTAQTDSGSVAILENKSPAPIESRYTENGFRSEKMTVQGGSELVTIFSKQGDGGEIPLVSVLRDTLGDEKPENDILRYVWLHSYTRPSVGQKIAAFIPFFYARPGSKSSVGTDPPPAVIDMRTSDKALWDSIFWFVLKKVISAEFGPIGKVSSSQYRQNASDYKKSAVAGALAVLSLYQQSEGEQVLSDQDLRDIQARLFLSDKFLGWHMKSENLVRVYEKETTLAKDYRGHNWELLRQYAEGQKLYFEPIAMPDGSSRHAVVWTTEEDVAANRGRKFDKRFLNISSPWGDDSLLRWKGYKQVRWFDENDRQVDPNTPGAKSRTMIPLALYGLDHPKIPMILIDFRDSGNPKRREMSKRVVVDVTSNLLSISKFSSIPYFVARTLYDFVPGRRGMDLNQISRLRSYAQLRLLLALDDSLDPVFRDKIEKKSGRGVMNPMENDAEAEQKLARAQYANLIAYAKRPDGLAEKVSNDRREEMVRLVHGKKQRMLYGIMHAVTFGLVNHREKATPELLSQLDMRRQLDYHERLVRQIADRSADPSVDSDNEALGRSLTFISQNGIAAEGKTARALAKVFMMVRSDDYKTLCLAGLYKIDNASAKKQLLAIQANQKVDDRWRDISARYLKQALQEGQKISKQDAILIDGITSRTGN